MQKKAQAENHCLRFRVLGMPRVGTCLCLTDCHPKELQPLFERDATFGALRMIWTSTSWGCSKIFKFLHANGFDRRLCPQDAAHTSCIGHHFSQFWSSLACSLRRFSFSMRFPSSPSCNVCDSGIAWRHEPLWRQISDLSFFVVSVGAFVHTGTPAHLSTLGGWGCCWWHAGPPPVDFHNFLVVTPGRMVETLGFWLRDMSPSCETSGTTGQTRPMVKTLQ